jgi:hypothetical protein
MDPTEAVTEAILRLVRAWNSKNELAFGALFTEQALYPGREVPLDVAAKRPILEQVEEAHDVAVTVARRERAA